MKKLIFLIKQWWKQLNCIHDFEIIHRFVCEPRARNGFDVETNNYYIVNKLFFGETTLVYKCKHCQNEKTQSFYGLEK